MQLLIGHGQVPTIMPEASFLLLYSEGLAKPSLTLWVDRLKDDRVLASLIGCTTNLLPPLGVACLVTGIQGMQPGELQ